MAGPFIETDLRSVFFDPNAFGHTGGCVYDGVTIEKIIFDDEDIEVDADNDGIGQLVAQAHICGAENDFPGVERGDPITVANKGNFRVIAVKRDGTGEITIYLEKV